MKFDVKKELQNSSQRKNETGAALAIAVIIIAILAVVGLTALAFSSTEARVAGSDLQRTHAFYAAAAGMEKMTNDFSNLFRSKMYPTAADLNTIALAHPPELTGEGFTFNQSIQEDLARLNELRAAQGLPASIYPRVNIPDGPYSGLYASIIPYKMQSTATQGYSKAEVKLEREFNNYLVPLFQFGMFSNEDIEVHPGPLMTFNGRVHTNQNLYALRNTKFLNRVTIAGELVRDATRGGEPNNSSGNNEVYFQTNNINIRSSLGNGSVMSLGGLVGGPFISGSVLGQRGFFPDSPLGVANPNWETESVKPIAAGVPNRFGGQVFTGTTGATSLKLPLEIGGNNPAELIKRSMPYDAEILAESRYHSKAQVRILIDDWNAGNGAANVAGIPAGKGVLLKNDATGFDPIPLGGGNALRRVSDGGAYLDTSTILQKKNPNGNSTDPAQVVRGVKNTTQTVSGDVIPAGSGIEARIYIEVVKPDGTTVDVTREILSMGMTVGEPNGIVYLQRPLWAAFVQGSRDRQGTNNFDLVNLTRNYQTIADGEITAPTAASFAANRGYLSMSIAASNDDGGTITRDYTPGYDNGVLVNGYNQIFPINIYNVREGWVRSSLSEYDIHERGLMSVIDINMHNLARWLDGVYDGNLLQGTPAVSTNIKGDEGYVVYISDRRGDKVKDEFLADGTTFRSTNGIVDNEDIYGPNSLLDNGEDVIDFGWNADGTSKKGTLQKDTTELPDSGVLGVTPATNALIADRIPRALTVLPINTPYFRRSVRLFDGETQSFTAAAGKLSPTKGITVSSENMIYIWGNYNTTGITGIPVDGSTLNNGGFTGAQVPSSIVADAFSPLSKTWFDALSMFYPEGSSDGRNLGGEPYRMADDNLPSDSAGTSVRTGVIAGNTISTLTAIPGKDATGLRRNGGIINYPRFLELWNSAGTTHSWNYTGSFVPLFRSTQATGQWENSTSITYLPPRRNWSFDDTFLAPQKLPPGTPFFQYVQATGFRQKLN
ncbi:MAG TPA: hypothetical protein PKY59_09150 [Pyrinomonadaceae bacterium]|nr:hypothetical protein [Pyrinomonadaceae bacterium]